jgi:hypothetical protein
MKIGYLEFRYNNRSHFDLRNGGTPDVTINIGDNIQSLAVRSLCSRLGIDEDHLIAVNRDDIANYDGEPVKLLMNGCFYRHCFPLPPSITPLFFGFNTNSVKVVRENKELFRKHAPIGCRDCATRDMFLSQGIPAYVTGCLTLTLEKQAQPPADGKVVISFGSGSGEFPGSLLQHIPGSLLEGATFIYQREPVLVRPLGDAEIEMADQTALRRLNTYRNEARLVITPLLHVASPCMALGIPVILARKNLDARFTALNKLTPVHTPENFRSINWSPQVVELESIKKVMANIVGRLIKGEPVEQTDIDFLSGVYDAKSIPTGGPTSPRSKSHKSRGKIYQFLRSCWPRK